LWRRISVVCGIFRWKRTMIVSEGRGKTNRRRIRKKISHRGPPVGRTGTETQSRNGKGKKGTEARKKRRPRKSPT
jgi:hypothetical protein